MLTDRQQQVATLILLVVLILGVGCSSSSDPEEDLPLEGPTWVMYSYGEPGEESRVYGSRYGIEMTFDSHGTLNGFTGCNSFTAQYTLSDDGILVISSMVAVPGICDEPLMTYELEILHAFNNLSRFEIDGVRLRVYYDNDAENLVFDGN